MKSALKEDTEMTNNFDAVIIGAGVFGSGIAFELSRRGLKTCNVDMNAAPGYGSTSSSGAILRFNYSTVPGIDLAWEGNRYWENFDEYLETTDERGHARKICLLYTSPSPRDATLSRMPSSA